MSAPVDPIASPHDASKRLRAHHGVRRLDLLRQFTAREIAARHRGSVLGFTWAILQPLLMLAIYTFVFQSIWNARWSSGSSGVGENGAGRAEFALSVFVGLLMFDVFSQTLSAAPTIIIQNSNLVKRVVFPIEILPAATLGAALAFSGIGAGVLLAGIATIGPGLSWTILLLPVIIVPLAFFTLGLALLVATLGVFVRDTRPIVVGALLPVLMFLTPVFYPLSRVPEGLRHWFAWNPLAVLIESARAVLLQHRAPEWGPLGATAIASLVIAALGYAAFMKGRRAFADVL